MNLKLEKQPSMVSRKPNCFEFVLLFCLGKSLEFLDCVKPFPVILENLFFVLVILLIFKFRRNFFSCLFEKKREEIIYFHTGNILRTGRWMNGNNW